MTRHHPSIPNTDKRTVHTDMIECVLNYTLTYTKKEWYN